MSEAKDCRIALALVENAQREALNPVALAEGLQHLIDQHGYTQMQLAEMIGKDRATVSNTLRLLKLPDQLREHVATGAIGAGHARALMRIHTHGGAFEPVLSKVLRDRLNTRETEELARKMVQGGASTGVTAKEGRLRVRAPYDSSVEPNSEPTLSRELRRRYAAMLQAFDLLNTGGHYTPEELFEAFDAEADGAIDKMIATGVLVEAYGGRYQAKNRKLLGAAFQDERAFAYLVGYNVGDDVVRAAKVLFTRSASLRSRGEAAELMRGYMGHRLCEVRFGLAALSMTALRAATQLPESIVASAERAALTDTQLYELIIALKRIEERGEPVTLAFLDLVQRYGLSAKRIRVASERLQQNQTLEEAVGELIADEPMRAEPANVEQNSAPEDGNQADVGQNGAPDDRQQVGSDEILTALLKLTHACFELCVQTRNLLVKLEPRITFLADELGYNKETRRGNQ